MRDFPTNKWFNFLFFIWHRCNKVINMENNLGKWAVIDIETTGADPTYDQVIDLGFLEFEGLNLVRKYSSLVQYTGELSAFIEKLTGINSKMLKNAPSFNLVENDLQELYSYKLLAHNSDFEKQFLQKSFDKIDDGENDTEFVDSLYLLGLLFPEYGTLKLEFFIKEWGLREKEAHRGFEDSIDLLKVILVAVQLVRLDKDFYSHLMMSIEEKKIEDFYLLEFLKLDDFSLDKIAEQIDFNLKEKVNALKESFLLGRKNLESDFIKRSKRCSMDFSGQNIKNIFENEELFTPVFPSYKKRQSQIDMAIRVGQSFKNNVHALIQAPTGTGKTFAYLIPSVLFSQNEKKQVLISTGTKTLQHQAYEKDVPRVLELLGLDESNLKIRYLVGSNNHICESLFLQEENEFGLMDGVKGFEEKYTSLYFQMVFYYNRRVKNDNKLLRDDLAFVLKKKIKKLAEREKEIAVDYRSCTGSKCPLSSSCSYLLGLREAKEADVIIGNHSLMFTWPKGMPRPAHIVVDEAHKIEEEATRSFSIEIEEISFKKYVDSIGHLQGMGSLFYLLSEMDEDDSATLKIKNLREESLKTYQIALDHLVPLSEAISLYFKKMPKYTEMYWNELPMITKVTHGDQLALKILAHVESLAFIFGHYLNVLLPYSEKFNSQDLKNENQILAYTRFESFYSQLNDYVNAFSALLDTKDNLCRSLKFLEAEGFIFSSAPINVGEIAKDQLLSISSSVVYTSATLANGNGDTGAKGIEWATGYTYLEQSRRFKSGLYLPPSYDYLNKTKIQLVDDLPPLYDKNFVKTVVKKLKDLIYSINGRTLLLFSAKTRFEEARELLLLEFEGKIPLFIQGMGGNVVLEFKESESGILLGMESFGEGIDIPGDSLQFIFIDKVPDLRMDLVINERRNFFEANLGNEFTDYYLSHRTRSLHQKLGRLLRTESDFGGVIIADSRIKSWKGKTMEKMVKLMEPYHLERCGIDQALTSIKDFILYQKDHLEI